MSTSSTDTPVCYRHPERAAYVKCQRCARNICPECQRPAAVGVLCPQCASTNMAVKNRTIFGGIAHGGPPVVTYSLIALCVFAYALEFIPQLHLVNLGAYAPVYTTIQPWRMLTSAFLHSPSMILHIALNMYMLWMVGPSLEHMLGRARYLTAYILCALGGSVGVLVFASSRELSWNTYTLGASGAIFGLFGMMLITQKRLGGSVQQILVLIAINLVFGFIASGISWQGHLGGLVTGLTVGAILAYAPAKEKNLYQICATILLVLLMVGIIYFKTTKVML